MAKVVTPLLCKVEAIGRPRQSSYQPGQTYQPVLFLDLAQTADNETAKIWKNLSEAEAAQLTVGKQVQLIPTGSDRNGKPKHNIVPLDADPNSATAPPPEPSVVLPTEQKRQIADYLHGQTALLAYVNQQTRQAFDGLPEETLMKYCLTLYLSAQRKFGF